MGATSGPYRINRLALQLEMTDGRMMTFYCSPAHAAAAEVTITTEYAPPLINAHPLVSTRRGQRISISIEDLTGYIMTLRQPDPAHWEAVENRKEIES